MTLELLIAAIVLLLLVRPFLEGFLGIPDRED